MLTLVFALAVGFGAIGVGGAIGQSNNGKPLANSGKHTKADRREGKPRR